MKKIMRHTVLSFLALSVLGIFSTNVLAANDPSIKGDLREDIKASMASFINAKSVNDTFFIYDPVKDDLMRLKFKKLHDGIVKKDDFYVSCADFVDRDGRLVDIDFLFVPKGNGLETVQGVVHSVDGKKRKYHLE